MATASSSGITILAPRKRPRYVYEDDSDDSDDETSSIEYMAQRVVAGLMRYGHPLYMKEGHIRDRAIAKFTAYVSGSCSDSDVKDTLASLTNVWSQEHDDDIIAVAGVSKRKLIQAKKMIVIHRNHRKLTRKKNKGLMSKKWPSALKFVKPLPCDGWSAIHTIDMLKAVRIIGFPHESWDELRARLTSNDSLPTTNVNMTKVWRHFADAVKHLSTVNANAAAAGGGGDIVGMFERTTQANTLWYRNSGYRHESRRTPMPQVTKVIADPPNDNRYLTQLVQASMKDSTDHLIDNTRRDRDGRIMLPFVVNDKLTVHWFGKIRVDRAYHTRKHVYPCGYKCTRIWRSHAYTCEITEKPADPTRPYFHIDNISGANIAKVWNKMRKSIDMQDDDYDDDGIESAEEFFGITYPKIVYALRELPRYSQLTYLEWTSSPQQQRSRGKHPVDTIVPRPIDLTLATGTATTTKTRTSPSPTPSSSSSPPQQQQQQTKVRRRKKKVAKKNSSSIRSYFTTVSPPPPPW